TWSASRRRHAPSGDAPRFVLAELLGEQVGRGARESERGERGHGDVELAELAGGLLAVAPQVLEADRGGVLDPGVDAGGRRRPTGRVRDRHRASECRDAVAAGADHGPVVEATLGLVGGY